MGNDYLVKLLISLGKSPEGYVGCLVVGGGTQAQDRSQIWYRCQLKLFLIWLRNSEVKFYPDNFYPGKVKIKS